MGPRRYKLKIGVQTRAGHPGLFFWPNGLFKARTLGVSPFFFLYVFRLVPSLLVGIVS